MTAKPEVIPADPIRAITSGRPYHSAKAGLWQWDQFWSTSRTGFN